MVPTIWVEHRFEVVDGLPYTIRANSPAAKTNGGQSFREALAPGDGQRLETNWLRDVTCISATPASPTVRALPAELAAPRGPFWMPIRGPNPTPMDTHLRRDRSGRSRGRAPPRKVHVSSDQYTLRRVEINSFRGGTRRWACCRVYGVEKTVEAELLHPGCTEVWNDLIGELAWRAPEHLHGSAERATLF